MPTTTPKNRLSERMQKVAAGQARSAAAGEPFRKPEKKYPNRVTLDLTAEDHRALKKAAFENETTIAELLRALVALHREDPKVAKAAAKKLQER